MPPRAIAKCPQCGQPVLMGEDFVCFKLPGKNRYVFIHFRRFTQGTDCSELYFLTPAPMRPAADECTAT